LTFNNDKKLVLYFLCFLSIALPARFTIATDALKNGHGTPRPISITNEKERKEYADKLKHFLETINASIPSLSPAEKEWVEKELKESNGTTHAERLINVTSSKEYYKYYVKSRLNLVIEVLNARKEKNNIDVEINSWLFIVNDLLLDFSFWESIHSLITMGIIDKNIFPFSENQDNYLFYLDNGAYTARLVIGNIIMPYQESKIQNR
jgi:hypothetical protein